MCGGEIKNQRLKFIVLLLSQIPLELWPGKNFCSGVNLLF